MSAPDRSTPIVVRAHLRSSVSLPTDSVAIDALLASAVVLRDGITPATSEDELVPIEIPLERADGGRFHLASVGHFDVEEHELRHITRRAPIEEYKAHGKRKMPAVKTTAGADKGSRIPMPVVHPVGGVITWWAIATDVDEVRSLLVLVSHIGKKRAVGVGRVDRWTVEPVEPWGPGFPIVLPDGIPARNLPDGWPGVRDGAAQGWRCITYPYWQRSREEMCYVAGVMQR